MAIHPDFARVDRADFDALHAGADFEAGGGVGEPEGFDHLLLPRGGGAIVGAHRGDEKGFGAVGTKPIADRFGDGNEVGDSSTPGSNGDISLRRFFAHLVEGVVDCLGHVLNRGRD